MAKFATYITDSDFETQVIRAISKSQGELLLRGVSLEQLNHLPADVLVVTCRKLNINNQQILVDSSMEIEEISELLTPNKEYKKFDFNKGSARLISIMGITGGVGTTSIAINYAFELAEQTSTTLVDLDERYPEIAQLLNLHNISARAQKVGPNLHISQGLPLETWSKTLVVDIGANYSHPILELSDLTIMTARLHSNTLNRLRQLPTLPDIFVCNFFERSKLQQFWLKEIQSHFASLRFQIVPYDPKSFELAAKERSALREIAPNSPARKHIATLG